MAGKIPHNSPVKKVENFKNHMKMNSLCEKKLNLLHYKYSLFSICHFWPVPYHKDYKDQKCH